MSLYRKARPDEVLTQLAVLTHGVNAGVGTAGADRLENAHIPQGGSTPLTRSKDRHRPGYTAEYMRKRRAKK